jgi:hypothetical protein
MAINKDVLDELLAGADGKDVFGKNGLFDELKKALAERMLNAEMDHQKTVLTDAAKIEIAVPRDRFAPRTPRRRGKSWKILTPALGAKNIRPSPRAGAGPGVKSFPSSPFATPCDGLSTQQTRLRV